MENYSIKRLEPLCGYDRLVAVTTASIASAAAGVRVNYGTNRRELEWHRRKDKPAWWRYFYLRTLSPLTSPARSCRTGCSRPVSEWSTTHGAQASCLRLKPTGSPFCSTTPSGSAQGGRASHVW